MVGKLKVIGICVSRFGDTPVTKFMERLNARLVPEDYRLFVYNTSSDLYWNRASERGDVTVFDLIDYDRLDLLIIFDEKFYKKSVLQKIIKSAHAHKVPVMIIGGEYEDCINVRFDYGKGLEDVMRHVIEMHRPKSFHFIAGAKGNAQSEERLSVFRNMLEEYGFPFSDDMVSYGDFWSEPTMRAVKKLITENRLPDAIICANDVMAIHTCNVLKDYGYEVPKDIIVTGFDGIDDAKYARPTLTTCECSVDYITNNIADLIIEAVLGEDVYGLHLMRPKTIIGGSCGCKPKKTISASDRVIEMNDRLYRFCEDDYSYAAMVSRMMTCHEIKEAASILARSELIFDTIFVLNPECVDETMDPAEKASHVSDQRCLFFDSEYPKQEPYMFSAKELLPNIHILLAQGSPLIFTAIHNLEIPLGYICFHFHNYSPANYDRMAQIVSMMNNAVNSLRTVRYQRHLVSLLEEQEQEDMLTGLLTRRAFLERYERLCEKAMKEQEAITFVFSDLDGLKKINDSYGHSEGDNAIRQVAIALSKIMPKDALVARFGGDEMIACCNGTYTAEELQEAMNDCLDDYNKTSQKHYRVGASLGVYVATVTEDLTFEVISTKADQLMYANKTLRKGSGDYGAGIAHK